MPYLSPSSAGDANSQPTTARRWLLRTELCTARQRPSIKEGRAELTAGGGPNAAASTGRRRHPLCGEDGMVTAELAVAIPSVVIVLALVLVAVSAGVTQLRVADAARSGARQAARGSGDVAAVAQHVGGAVSVTVETGALTCVSASRPVIGPLGGLGLRASARACAYTEPTSNDAGAQP
ncbi:TadE family type IV pilus minor pilin [Actinomyces trachealis]|uniref:TadE family type IV pilus minor pilin n=1 Tax=Actinomyces trachealis TaxID=2763540 RepID=UPI001F450134|nr:TadE family type IV pilus minor pilin [Actinomyces trachealis]